MAIDDITSRIIGAAIAVHRQLGPGLLESIYHRCLAIELAHVGLAFQSQIPIPIIYRDTPVDCGYRLDFIVERCVIVEVKAVESLHPVHHAQLLTYLKLTTQPVGLLINFNVARLSHGIKRLVLDPTHLFIKR